MSISSLKQINYVPRDWEFQTIFCTYKMFRPSWVINKEINRKWQVEAPKEEWQGKIEY